MKHSHAVSGVLKGVRVPRTLVRNAPRFGGVTSGDCVLGDLKIERGCAVSLFSPSEDTKRIVLPCLTEPHVHLDKCHTVDRMAAGGGDLLSAIAKQWDDKRLWTEADLEVRIARGLRELEQSGVATVRTHIDWGPTPGSREVPLAWDVIGNLATKFPDISVQRAALLSINQLAERVFALRTAKLLAHGGGVLGSFVFGQRERGPGIEASFAMAEQFGLALDFHVDEGLESELDGVELIADTSLRRSHQGPVLLGHACALANMADEAFKRIAGKLAEARIAVCALPTTNLYLQGRGRIDPVIRGLTRIKSLRAAGVTVCLGTDNVCDAFCPIGKHDPRQTLACGALAAHLDPPFAEHLPMITTEARVALGLCPIFVDGADAKDLIVVESGSTNDFLSKTSTPKRVEDVLRTEGT